MSGRARDCGVECFCFSGLPEDEGLTRREPWQSNLGARELVGGRVSISLENSLTVDALANLSCSDK